MKKILLKNCKIPTRPGFSDIIIQNGKITAITNTLPGEIYPDSIDINGKTVVPGFIDLHIHGAGGGEVYKARGSEFRKITATLISCGVTTITPTTIVNPEDDYRQLRDLSECLDENYPGTRLSGLHLEGPFINKDKRGGIPATSVKDYSKQELLTIINILGDKLKIMTMAPEISPNMEMIDILLDHNIVPALGHTNISYEDAHKSFDKGLKHVTHIFNAMPAFHHREPGPLLAIFERQDVSAQIISDGVHLNPAVVRYLYHTLGIENCICVSDGQSVIGLSDGKYDINGGIYLKQGEKATDIDGNLIGTAMDVGAIARKFKGFTNCSDSESWKTITMNPANVLGMESEIGSVETGKTADLVILNNDTTINAVFVNGDIAFQQ